MAAAVFSLPGWHRSPPSQHANLLEHGLDLPACRHFAGHVPTNWFGNFSCGAPWGDTEDGHMETFGLVGCLRIWLDELRPRSDCLVPNSQHGVQFWWTHDVLWQILRGERTQFPLLRPQHTDWRGDEAIYPWIGPLGGGTLLLFFPWAGVHFPPVPYTAVEPHFCSGFWTKLLRTRGEEDGRPGPHPVRCIAERIDSPTTAGRRAPERRRRTQTHGAGRRSSAPPGVPGSFFDFTRNRRPYGAGSLLGRR